MVDEAFDRFVALAQELARNDKALKRLVITMPVGFPEARELHEQKVNQLKARNAQIYRDLLPTALESLENHPNTHQEINSYLMQHLSLQLSGKNWKQIPYNPVAALRMFKKLESAGIDAPLLSLLGYRANLIMNDLEQARLLLIKAATQGRRETAAMENLKSGYKGWLREKAFIKTDTENDNNPRVKIETDAGDMIVELFEDQAPNTVANFISLVESDFYNGLDFYQTTVSDLVVSGSPTNDGLGGPGYKISCECSATNARQHFTGYIATYPTRKDEGGSRFLITKQPRPSYDGKTTVFGRIIEGLENLYKIQIIDLTRPNTNPEILPTKIKRMSVIRKRDHEYVPVKVTASTPETPGN